MAEHNIKDTLSSVAEYIGEAVATKENAFRVSTMPAASVDYAGEIYQYVGATDASYTNGYYYECAEDNGVYGWQQINVQPSNESGQTIQYDEMPVASENNEDVIVQYVGETTSVAPIYINGYFYKCKAQGTDPETYAWERTNVQPTSEGDERIKPEITEMGVKFDDGLRPYIKVDISKIIPPFADATWEQIAEVLRMYYAGDLALQQLQLVWSLGDSKSITTAQMDGQAEQTNSYRIVDFDHDTLTDSIGGKTKSAITLACASRLDSTMNLGGYVVYPSIARHAWLNSDYYEALPEGVRSLIKQVTKNSYGGDFNAKIFLASQDEINGTVQIVAEGTQYELYKTQNYPNSSWTRTPNTTTLYNYRYVTSGNVTEYQNPSTNSFGIVPHFCL